MLYLIAGALSGLIMFLAWWIKRYLAHQKTHLENILSAVILVLAVGALAGFIAGAAVAAVFPTTEYRSSEIALNQYYAPDGPFVFTDEDQAWYLTDAGQEDVYLTDTTFSDADDKTLTISGDYCKHDFLTLSIRGGICFDDVQKEFKIPKGSRHSFTD